MRSLSRLDDPIADLHRDVVAYREYIVGVVQKESHRAAGDRRQVQPRRLQVDCPSSAGARRRRERDDLGGNRTWPI